jgi:hypothetical protein
MDLHLRLVAIAATVTLFLVVLELVRRRRLLERYALLWLFSTTALLALSAWSGLLEIIADAIGISYAPSALFVIAFGFTLFLMLHFSVVISRLSEQSKMLAQRLALLEQRHREAAAGSPGADGGEREPEAAVAADSPNPELRRTASG